MPTDTIVDQFTRQFGDTLHEVAQHSDSKVRSACEEKHGIPEDYTYEHVGKVEARKLIGRTQPATFDDIQHTRRLLEKDHYVLNLPVDEHDLQNVATDPRSSYAQMINYGFNRLVDKVALTAALASVKTGKNGGTTTTFTNDGGFTVTATGGMTLAHLLTIQRNWTDKEVAIRGSNNGKKRKLLCITGEEEEDLLNIAQLTSGDYDRRYQLEEGELMFAVGLEIVKFGGAVDSPILVVAAGIRQCVAFVDGAVLLGFGQDYDLSIKERVDYENVWQIKGRMSVGGVRTEGVKVQLVNTTD